MQKIYLITWPNGSGKGTVAEYIHNRYGAIIYRFSNPLYHILSELWVVTTRENLAILSKSLRTNFGEDILGRWVLDFIQKNTENLIVLEWIRRVETMQSFSQLIDTIVWIDADDDIRYSRISLRQEKNGEYWLSREEFDRQELLETEKTLAPFKSIAHILIENNGTKEELYSKIDTFCKNV